MPNTSVGSPPAFLPADLESGFTAAEFLLLHVEQVVHLFAVADVLPPGPEADADREVLFHVAGNHLFELEAKLADSRDLILQVSNEITSVTRAPVRVPTVDNEWLMEPNAHHATIGLARGLLELTLACLVPPAALARARQGPTPLRKHAGALERAWPQAARSVAASVWPDGTHLRELLMIEAASVAHQRRSMRPPGQTSVGAAAPASDASGLPDGPVPPHWLRWRGELIRIGSSRAQLPYRLLAYFWARPSATFDELHGAGRPWPDPVSESAIASAVNRFNTVLPADFPWRLATKAYCVFKESRENPLV